MGFQYFPTIEAVRAAVDAMYMTTIKSHFSRQLIKRWRGRLDFVDLVMKMSGNNLEGAMYTLQAEFGNDTQVSSKVKNKVHKGLKEASKLRGTSLIASAPTMSFPSSQDMMFPGPFRGNQASQLLPFPNNQPPQPECWACGGQGHRSRNCPNNRGRNNNNRGRNSSSFYSSKRGGGHGSGKPNKKG